MIRVTATVPLYPTEDPQVIKAALTTIFPDMVLHQDNDNEGSIFGEATTLENFAFLLKNQMIRATARTILLEGLEKGYINFSLNKQVATVGKVNFQSGPQPLGSIDVEITGDDLKGLIDRITPAINVAKISETDNGNP